MPPSPRLPLTLAARIRRALPPLVLLAVLLAVLPAALTVLTALPARAAEPDPPAPPAAPALPAAAPTPAPSPPAFAPAAQPQRTRPAPDALILLDGSEDFAAAAAAIEAQGGAPLHSFPPHVVIAALPAAAENALRGRAGIVEIARGPVDAGALRSRYGDVAAAAAAAWNRLRTAGAPDPAAAAGQPGAPLVNDALQPPAGGAPPDGWSDRIGAADAPAGSPGYWDTSSFLIGRVAVGIVLPESDGGSEDWRAEDPSWPGVYRPDLVIWQIMMGLDSWAGAEPNARLEFVYDVNIRVPTAYEPIAVSSSDHGLWIEQVMNGLGWGWPSDWFGKVRQFDNDLRSAYAADWAFTFFVVDSFYDDDGMMPDGRFGYAYLGGPFSVLTYDNDGWGIDLMYTVAAHEAAHIFYALDEYAGAYVSCPVRTGYLGVENQNSQYHPGGSCALDEPCIMRSGYDAYTSCPYTRMQVGWRDEDGDGILDPADTSTYLTLAEPWPPEQINDPTPRYAGAAEDLPLPSEFLYPVSINKIERIQYSLDGGWWVDVPALDGRLGDESWEEYGFTLGPLADGDHRLYVHAVNSAGNGVVDGGYIWDTFTLDTVPPSAALELSKPYGGADFLDFWVWWEGQDERTGIAGTTVEVRDGSGPWAVWLETGEGVGYQRFIGRDGHTYTFRARARDGAGNAGAYATAAHTVSVCPAAPDAGESAPRDDLQQYARPAPEDGSSRAHTFDQPGDADWVAFETVAGVEYTVVTENTGGYGDTVLTVLLPDGSTLENDDDPDGGWGSRLAWVAAGSGTAHARVVHYDPNASGCQASYSLRIATDDYVAPEAALLLADGGTWANRFDVPAFLAAQDVGAGLWQMRVAEGDVGAGAWQPYSAEFSVQLSAWDGGHTVFAQVMDRAGLLSAVAQDDILVDATPPVATLAPLPAAPDPGEILVAWSATDNLSGVWQFDVEVRDGAGGAWNRWLSGTALREATLFGTDGHIYWVRVRARDGASNESSWVTSGAVVVGRTFIYLPVVGGR